ncbi:MAG: hypothetical protein SNJ59_11215 [Aggregatilineales bacterium]
MGLSSQMLTTGVKWLDAGHAIICVSLVGQWTIGEFNSAINQCKEMIEQVRHEVYGTVDYTHSGPPPFGIIWHIRRAVAITPANVKLVIGVTHNTLIHNIIETVTRVYTPKHFDIVVVRTMTEALALIDADRAASGSAKQS